MSDERAEALDKVTVHNLPLYADARGWLMVGPKDWGYGPPGISYTYATTCYPGVVKAWHRHAGHTDRLWCVSGMARVVVLKVVGKFDSAEEDVPDGAALKYALDGTAFAVYEFVIGPLAPKVIVIPPGWWHGFTPAGPEPCVIINAPDMAYDPEDEERKSIEAIPFPWREVDG